MGILARSFPKTKKCKGRGDITQWQSTPGFNSLSCQKNKNRHTKHLASSSNTTSIYKIPSGESCLVGLMLKTGCLWEMHPLRSMCFSISLRELLLLLLSHPLKNVAPLVVQAISNYFSTWKNIRENDTLG